MAIREEVLKELLEGYKKPEDLLGPEGLLKKLTAALVEKALGQFDVVLCLGRCPARGTQSGGMKPAWRTSP